MQISLSIVGAFSFLLLLFSLHLFFSTHGNHLLNRVLSVVFFARFGQMIVYVLITSGQLKFFPFFQSMFTPFYYAAPACLYLYITGFINNHKHFQRTDWLHSIPFFLAIVHVLPWHFSTPIDWVMIAKQISENKQLFITQRSGLFPSYFYYFGRPLLLFGYLIAAWREVFISALGQQKKWESNKIWVYFCLSTATVFNLISILPFLFGRFHQPVVSHSWFVIVNCAVLLSVIVFVFHQPRLLYGYVLVAANLETSANEVESLQLIPPVSKSNLLPDQLLKYRRAMEELMENEKPFLLPDFQILHLAQKINIPVHHCSFVINNVIGKNFRDWINSYRVHNFIVIYPLLSAKMTIEAIAYQSGFKSVATFYNAFKKEAGSMPKAYFSKPATALI
jgi:AraC-like DNA-binding protein